MSDFIARNVTILDFSNPRNIQLPEIYHPSSCVIQLGHKTIDIGSHCYEVHKINNSGYICGRTKNSQGIFVIKVKLDSLNESRLPLIRKLIEYAADRATVLNPYTLATSLQNVLLFFQFYFNQPDLDYLHSENRHHYEEAARRYSAAVLADKKKAWTKYKLTKAVYQFAEFLYDGELLNKFDYDIIPNTDKDKYETIPLLPEEYELALALRTAIFEGVTDLLVNKRPLPYRLKVPAACGELNDTIWLGYKPWGGPGYIPRAKDFDKNQPKEWFDREKGALVTKAQWLDRTDHASRKDGHGTWYNIQRNLRYINSDHSSLKTTLAEYASLCFIDLLLSMTGMNQQPALDLPWYGGYFVQKAKQGNKIISLVTSEDQVELTQAEAPSVYLRSIKNRKGYQPVEVTITNRFLPQFKQYLQLREYYLNGKTDTRLFPFSAKLIHNRRHSLHGIFPEIPKLGVHKARAGVSDSVLTATDDPHAAAQVLQNNPETVIKHYAAGTQKAHIQSVGGFFNTLGNQIKVSRLATENNIETAVGSCDQGGAQPDPLPDSPLEVNCNQQEGCFFCKHYSVHADEIDIRKLVSVLYYINKGATRAHDVDFFNELFQLIIARIKDLLEQIEAISTLKKALVSRIKEEVFTEEALDEYWLLKLNRVEKLVGGY